MKSLLVVSSFIPAVLVANLSFATSTASPNIDQRQANQERRIDQGVSSGQLTPKEAGRLEAQQAKISQDEERMKADGKLTKKERRKLQNEQDRASDNIYRKKHNKKKVPVQ